MQRRAFIRNTFWAGLLAGAGLKAAPFKPQSNLIKPPALRHGDTVGLVTPASSLFERKRTLIEATEKMEGIGYKVKTGKHIFAQNGYLAGSIKQRVDDLHDMFRDPDVKAIIAIRGGYGSGQLLPYLDYELIRQNPKIILGYSDITSLHIGIYQKTGLVTFHGPVAISTFTDYTRGLMQRLLGEAKPLGLIADAPYEDNLQKSARILTLRGGRAEGKLMGGNMTLMQATLGTPWEFDSDDSILFFEEVGEQPYDIDRILNHMKMAGKFDRCKGVIFDKMPSVRPGDDAAFNRNLSLEEVLEFHLGEYDFPVCLGFSLGHIKNKPTMPLGIRAELDADKATLSIAESAVLE